MLGEKKTLPFWRRRRPNLLAQERALAPTARTSRESDAENAVMEREITRDRVEVSKGRIHPPT